MKLIYSKLEVAFMLLIFLFAATAIEAQTNPSRKANQYLSQKGEITFSFQINDVSELKSLSSDLSILNYNPKTQTVYAWANTEQFRRFESSNRIFEVKTKDNEATGIVMSNELPVSQNRGPYPLTFPLAAYPTYADYASQMQEFAINHPDICELVDIGGTTEGAGGGNKRLLFLKLSDNITTDEAEPKLMYTSSMHGDEITGYPLMLDLINYFITAYKNTGHSDHLRIKNLIDNSEIWINPMANPDGTYYNNASNTSVVNSRRANANNIDLNRNYPDNVAGPHSNGHTSYELETQHFMNLAANTHFVLSANFHGGIEVVNYPWDNTYDRHADDDWFVQLSREYADNAQANSPNGYMTALNNGITHGADWYRVYGGRQDYMNFTHQCKETTMELSDIKITPANQLVNHWNYNREALIEYLIQGTYGFHGSVEDAVTGNPIEATITLVGHDALGSHTISTLPHGDFYRPVYAGNYTILIEAPCYQSVTLTNETIANYQTKNLGTIQLSAATATAPTNLTNSGTDSSSSLASWTSAPSDSYDLRYREVGTLTWVDVLVVTTNSYQITGLSPNTTYEFQVRSNCGSVSSVNSALKQFTTTNVNYCVAEGGSITDEFIGIVSINGTSHNTVSTTTSGYSDLTATSVFGDLDILTNATGNTISVTKHWTGGNYNEAVTIWIDFNQNGTFETAERIFRRSSNQTNPVSGTFDIPNDAVLGNTRMRVLMKYYSGAGSNANNPCETFNYGEVEDYNLNITNSTLSTSSFDTNAIKVYPNPFNNSVNIKLIENNPVNIDVFDISGRTISKQKNIVPVSQIITLSNMDKLSAGTYFIQITDNTGDKTVVKRIIKQ
tara:strand:- start:5204 stop:7735 length:2532 start_codon:yes stop_codon:yes gene_type:complete